MTRRRLHARAVPIVRPKDERGFTLVELLVSVTILAVIIGPISAGLIIGLRTSADTAARLTGSSGAQSLAIALPPDLESTGKVVGDLVASPSANTECSGVTNVLRLRWTTADTGAAVTYQAAYSVSGNATAGWKLSRSFCVGAAAAMTRTVTRNLASATAATVVVVGTKVTMTVIEAAKPVNYSFSVSGNRRTP